MPVTLLGHVFEQSITDIERLKAAARASRSRRQQAQARRRRLYARHGHALSRRAHRRRLAREAFDALCAAPWHGRRREPKRADRVLARLSRRALRDFTILDPACGSGAFLVAAFDALAAEYARAARRWRRSAKTIDFDIFDEIVTKNLYGVDLNPESVEITRLSLWLKTARRSIGCRTWKRRSGSATA